MQNQTQPRFHLAFPVTDLEATRNFYCDILDCKTGRESDHWIDFDFCGHQIVAHLVVPEDHPMTSTNAVDGHAVPASHFGLILEWNQYERLVTRLQDLAVEFVIAPYTRFEGRRGEQATLFIRDPSGNHLEFKAFRDITTLFDKDLDQY
jgi:extradiol dioxygenase family protein